MNIMNTPPMQFYSTSRNFTNLCGGLGRMAVWASFFSGRQQIHFLSLPKYLMPTLLNYLTFPT